jgi:BRCA1/BRCA2-containing complex subunit 3
MDFYSHPDTSHSTSYQPRENALILYNPDNTQEASVDPYDSDMTPSLQEALHRSTMDIRYPNNV